MRGEPYDYDKEEKGEPIYRSICLRTTYMYVRSQSEKSN